MVGFMIVKTFLAVRAGSLPATLMTLLLFIVLITGRPYGDESSRAFTRSFSSPQSSLHPETARSAFDFLNSIGVNTHLNYFDTRYGDFAFVSRELRSVGIRHLRDGVHLQNPDYNHVLYNRWKDLGESGIRFDAVLDPRSNLGAITPALLEKIDELSGHSIDSFEGPNELDISDVRNWPSVDRSFQQALFTSAQSLPDRKAIRIIGPSLAFARHSSDLGNISDFLDEGNLHPYPAAKMPSIIFPEQIDLARIAFGNKEIVVTESGYHNGLNDHSDQPGVSDAAAAKYIPRLYLENFLHGIARTYLYEFFDESPDRELRKFQMHWGLIRSDGTEKPAFTAMKNLIAELNDDAPPTQLGQLVWSLSSSDPRIDHVLLQKSNGEYDLVLWLEAPSYNYKDQRDLPDTHQPAVLTLKQKVRSMALYEPVIQADPIGTYTNVSHVSVNIPDHPLVVRILSH
jgi:hypothetical protein